MRLVFVLLFALVACTRVTKLSVVEPPPTFAELAGAYSTQWGGTAVLGGASIVGDTIRFAIYPCRPVGSLDDVGGTFEYDPSDGSLTAEVKSIDGAARVVIDATARGDEIDGSYRVEVIGLPCVEGQLAMQRTAAR